jgi:hypothetical protein
MGRGPNVIGPIFTFWGKKEHLKEVRAGSMQRKPRNPVPFGRGKHRYYFEIVTISRILSLGLYS